MGFPEKERKDESKKQGPKDPPPPKLDAIMPHSGGPNVFREIDDYQKKIENEWESAKENYQKKIDKIMDDFITQTGGVPDPGKPIDPASPEMPKGKIPSGHPTEAPLPFPKSATDEKLDRLMDNVHKTLQQVEYKSHLLAQPERRKPPIINVAWKPMRPWYRRLRNLFLGALVAGGIGFGVWYTFIRVNPVTPLPYPHTSGLLIQGKDVYIIDWFRRALYVHSLQKGLPITAAENLPNPFTTGFTMTEKNLLTVDGLDNKILIHTLTPDHRVTEKSEASESKLAGLYYDGTDIWVFDNGNGKLKQLHGRDLEEIRDSFSLTNVTVSAFQIKTNRVWILEGKTREVHVYRLQEPMRHLATFDLDPFINGATPTGIHVGEKTVSIATEGPAQFVQISRRKLEQSRPEDY